MWDTAYKNKMNLASWWWFSYNKRWNNAIQIRLCRRLLQIGCWRCSYEAFKTSNGSKISFAKTIISSINRCWYTKIGHQYRILLQADTYNIHELAINFAVVHAFIYVFISLMTGSIHWWPSKLNLLWNKNLPYRYEFWKCFF